MRRPPSGFSLLEVMVAVAILAISLTTLLMFSGNTMVKSGRAERLITATLLARQKMTEIEIDMIEAGKRNEIPDDRSESGSFDEPFEDYSWSMQIRPVDLPTPVMGEEGGIQAIVARQLTAEISKSVRELNLTITWQEMGEEQSYEVVTHIVKL